MSAGFAATWLRTLVMSAREISATGPVNGSVIPLLSVACVSAPLSDAALPESIWTTLSRSGSGVPSLAKALIVVPTISTRFWPWGRHRH